MLLSYGAFLFLRLIIPPAAAGDIYISLPLSREE